ncbi:hypothetical protein [Yeosuana marina]|uniref:hypothetical protein n=1 Tax=Yeosuana marina TaxID=1565536 RepID=UPI0030C8C9D2
MENINKEQHTDLRYYLEDINYRIKESHKQKNRVRFILKFYSFFGLIIAIISLIFFISSFYELKLDFEQTFALILGGVGLFVALISKFYVELTKEREKEKNERKKELENISNFIITWSTLERATNHFFVLKRLANNKYAIGRNLQQLSERGIINMRDYLTLEKALEIRNRIVHDNIISSNEDLEKLSDEVIRITDKIIDSTN